MKTQLKLDFIPLCLKLCNFFPASLQFHETLEMWKSTSLFAYNYPGINLILGELLWIVKIN